MKIYIGADHRGVRLKARLVKYLSERKGLDVVDLGPEKIVSDDDYPDISAELGITVRDDKGSLGILLCGSGAGACIAANKVRGIRATLAPDAWTAQAARNDDDANVVCIAASHETFAEAKRIARAFIQSSFSLAKRHRRRVAKVKKLDKERP